MTDYTPGGNCPPPGHPDYDAGDPCHYAPVPTPPPAEIGITETRQFLEFVLALARALRGARADGKVNIMDLGQLMQVIPHIAPALQGAGNIPKELADLSEAEFAEVKGKVATALDIAIDSPDAGAIAEDVLKVVFHLGEIVKRFAD